jgi:hypothetical protein
MIEFGPTRYRFVHLFEAGVSMFYDTTYTLISPFWHFFECVSPGEWLVFLAELFVGWVIFLELEHSHDMAFLAKITSEHADEDRLAIYESYLSVVGTEDVRLGAFLLELRSPTMAAADLRRSCHSQLAMFNEMGYQTGRWLRFKRRRYVSVFPHAPVFFWFIVGRHVLDRREATGTWFGYHALNFINASVKYVMKRNRAITLRIPGNQNQLVITVAEMQRMRNELTRLGRENSWLRYYLPFFKSA